ncbi:MAG: ExbD/TolR family protein [Planctomycetota bacterium]|jgi:biopolymer transport protein ExbD
MITLRRTDHEARVEIMPLIDVIFLLLTFFIYAMVLMIRAELLPMQLQAFGAGEPARPAAAATISILLDGTLHFNREPVQMEELPDRIAAARATDPDTKVYLALEDGEGTMDRGPVLTRLWDSMKDLGIEIYFVGRPKE